MRLLLICLFFSIFFTSSIALIRPRKIDLSFVSENQQQKRFQSEQRTQNQFNLEKSSQFFENLNEGFNVIDTQSRKRQADPNSKYYRYSSNSTALLPMKNQKINFYVSTTSGQLSFYIAPCNYPNSQFLSTRTSYITNCQNWTPEDGTCWLEIYPCAQNQAETFYLQVEGTGVAEVNITLEDITITPIPNSGDLLNQTISPMDYVFYGPFYVSQFFDITLIPHAEFQNDEAFNIWMEINRFTVGSWQCFDTSTTVAETDAEVFVGELASCDSRWFAPSPSTPVYLTIDGYYLNQTFGAVKFDLHFRTRPNRNTIQNNQLVTLKAQPFENYFYTYTRTSKQSDSLMIVVERLSPQIEGDALEVSVTSGNFTEPGQACDFFIGECTIGVQPECAFVIDSCMDFSTNITVGIKLVKGAAAVNATLIIRETNRNNMTSFPMLSLNTPTNVKTNASFPRAYYRIAKPNFSAGDELAVSVHSSEMQTSNTYVSLNPDFISDTDATGTQDCGARVQFTDPQNTIVIGDACQIRNGDSSALSSDWFLSIETPANSSSSTFSVNAFVVPIVPISLSSNPTVVSLTSSSRSLFAMKADGRNASSMMYDVTFLHNSSLSWIFYAPSVCGKKVAEFGYAGLTSVSLAGLCIANLTANQSANIAWIGVTNEGNISESASISFSARQLPILSTSQNVNLNLAQDANSTIAIHVTIGQAFHIFWNQSISGGAALTLFNGKCDATYQPTIMKLSTQPGFITINSGSAEYSTYWLFVENTASSENAIVLSLTQGLNSQVYPTWNSVKSLAPFCSNYTSFAANSTIDTNDMGGSISDADNNAKTDFANLRMSLTNNGTVEMMDANCSNIIAQLSCGYYFPTVDSNGLRVNYCQEDCLDMISTCGCALSKFCNTLTQCYAVTSAPTTEIPTSSGGQSTTEETNSKNGSVSVYNPNFGIFVFALFVVILSMML